MSKCLEDLQKYYNEGICIGMDKDTQEMLEKCLKELKALEIIKNIFNIQILGDYLVAQKGETFVAENLKLKQSQEIINLLKKVLKNE